MLYIKLIVIYNIIILLDTAGALSKYCDICTNHTLCLYSIPGPNSRCVEYDVSSLLKRSDVEEILNRVNDKRNFIAQGLSRKLPKAANMRKIRWSDELATFAQRWADQCTPGVDDKDDCRDLSKHNPVGQTTATVMGPSPGLSVKAFIDIWFMQLLDYNGSISYYNGSQDNRTDFFTQLIWADTDLMGCGKVKFYLTSKRSVAERLVCNFAPKGNTVGKPVYAIGYPSTQCPLQMKPDKIFTGLCTYIDAIDNTSPSPSSPFVSLLRIINLSNPETHNETGINPGKDKNNHRLQKIRHILNDTEIADLEKFHEAEEKFKDYLVRLTGEHNTYDYIHGKEYKPEPSTTSKYIYLPPYFLQYDFKPIVTYHTYRNPTKLRLCTRSTFSDRTNKYDSVLSFITNRCTRTDDDNLSGKNYASFRDNTRCNCNADCHNPEVKYYQTQSYGSRRRKILITEHPFTKEVAVPKSLNYYDHYYNPQKNQNFLRGMYLSQQIRSQQLRNDKSDDSYFKNKKKQWIRPAFHNMRSMESYYPNEKRKKRMDEVTFKPFWQVEDYKPKPVLKYLKFTTLANKNNKIESKTSKTNNEKVLRIKASSTKKQQKYVEKFLSFEELMHLRKHNEADGHRNAFLESGRRTDTNATETSTNATEPTTTETLFQHVKYCTKRLTCTWTAVFQKGAGNGGGGGIIGGGGGGGGIGGGFGLGGGPKTPPGYVSGCTRTWTCTREYFERNKGATSGLPASSSSLSEESEDEEYCEKRALERRNLDNSDYTLTETLTVEKNTPILYTTTQILYATTPMPSYYESNTHEPTNLEPTSHKEEITEACECTEEDNRKRRHIETRRNSVINSDLSYGDLFYLVIQKIITNSKVENRQNKNCLCNSTAGKNINIILFVFLCKLIFHLS